MKILEEVIEKGDLSQSEYILDEEMVKAVVDIEREIVEFDSMINVRPRQSNRSRDVENPEIRRKIREMVGKWVK